MQPLFEHRLTLAGYETRALELEGDGPPTLLIHGYGDSADCWRLVMDQLAKQGRQALAIDMPGFGLADHLKRGLIMPQLDSFVAAAIRQIAPDGGAIVMGNSLGGAAALRAAENDELGIDGIVPVAPAGLDMARWFTLIERDIAVRSLLAAPVPIPGFATRLIVAEVYKRLAFARTSKVDQHVANTFASHFSSQKEMARKLDIGRRLIPEMKHPFKLGRIKCRVRLIWGTHDAMVFQTGAERVLETVPDSELIVLEGYGHCPQIEAPERVTELLVEFSAPLARVA